MDQSIDWSKPHILKTSTQSLSLDDLGVGGEDRERKISNYRKEIEPWLSAIFQSEHFSLLLGSGLTAAVSVLAKTVSQGMSRITFKHKYGEQIKKYAEESAKSLARGKANIEDDFRAAIELLTGLRIQDSCDAATLKTDLDQHVLSFTKGILGSEKALKEKLELGTDERKLAENALQYLKTFLLSFSSRSASRERLNIFTTNYERFIEYGCDEAGIILLDRFKGKLLPIFRNTKLELDYHYNPPGIRGEPRYVEGVVRISKLHGSIDWRFDKDRIIRCLLPFGAADNHPEVDKQTTDSLVIYPNSSKAIETSFYPYSELFRDFSSGICKPNSVVVTYGYGFGDTHINQIIEDMLTIPSTHLIIISWDNAEGRIENFYKKLNKAQFTLLIGNHFGDLVTLVDNYLPKSTIDRLTMRKVELLEKRGEGHKRQNEDQSVPIGEEKVK
jgi:hypothetical protein